MATTVTGPIGATYDAVFDGISATLTRVGGVVGYAETGGAIAPDQKTYVTSGGGVLTMEDLKPGRYTLSLSVPISESTSQTKLWEAAGVIQVNAGDNITLDTFLTANVEPLTPTLVQQAIAARDAAEASAATATTQAGIATTQAGNAASSAAEANTFATQAELAALAAGAPIVTTLTDPVPANGTVELLKLDAGLQVHEVEAGAWVLRGWLVGPEFDTVQALLDNTATTLGATGQIVHAGGFRYEVAAPSTTDPHVITAGGVKLLPMRPAPATGFAAAQWGIFPDGTDRTARIMAAVTALGASGGGKIFFGPGVYRVKPNGTGRVTLASGVILEGLYPAFTSLRSIDDQDAGSSGSVVTIPVASVGAGVRRMTIDGNRPVGPGPLEHEGIDADGDRMIIEEVDIINAVTDGLDIDQGRNSVFRRIRVIGAGGRGLNVSQQAGEDISGNIWEDIEAIGCAEHRDASVFFRCQFGAVAKSIKIRDHKGSSAPLTIDNASAGEFFLPDLDIMFDSNPGNAPRAVFNNSPNVNIIAPRAKVISIVAGGLIRSDGAGISRFDDAILHHDADEAEAAFIFRNGEYVFDHCDIKFRRRGVEIVSGSPSVEVRGGTFHQIGGSGVAADRAVQAATNAAGRVIFTNAAKLIFDANGLSSNIDWRANDCHLVIADGVEITAAAMVLDASNTGASVTIGAATIDHTGTDGCIKTRTPLGSLRLGEARITTASTVTAAVELEGQQLLVRGTEVNSPSAARSITIGSSPNGAVVQGVRLSAALGTLGSGGKHVITGNIIMGGLAGTLPAGSIEENNRLAP